MLKAIRIGSSIAAAEKPIWLNKKGRLSGRPFCFA
jgi:hypothetical protein